MMGERTAMRRARRVGNEVRILAVVTTSIVHYILIGLLDSIYCLCERRRQRLR